MTRFLYAALVCVLLAPSAGAQLAIRAKTLHTMGPAGTISDGVVICRDGKIAAVGPASATPVPADCKTIDAAVVTPGLIDAHSTVGLSGLYNQPHDSDQLERSAPIQPELRAIDAYNPREKLIEYVRGFGVTTLHTGHAPGELISGQTMIVKTLTGTTEAALVRSSGAIAATIGPAAQKDGKASPGTRGKSIALLRAELIKAQEYDAKRKAGEADAEKLPERSLRLEALVGVLHRETPLMVTCNRAQDISGALRLAKEFDLRLWLDGAAEAYLLIDEIKAAGVPVIIHPTMQRAWGEAENLSFETAGRLHAAGIPIAFQAGYESYVPKTRIVLFEAAMAAANGMPRDAALAAITRDSAGLLGIADRAGSIEPGKDADLALYDGDPFEYATHCVGTVIYGVVVSDRPQ